MQSRVPGALLWTVSLYPHFINLFHRISAMGGVCLRESQQDSRSAKFWANSHVQQHWLHLSVCSRLVCNTSASLGSHMASQGLSKVVSQLLQCKITHTLYTQDAVPCLLFDQPSDNVESRQTQKSIQWFVHTAFWGLSWLSHKTSLIIVSFSLSTFPRPCYPSVTHTSSPCHSTVWIVESLSHLDHLKTTVLWREEGAYRAGQDLQTQSAPLIGH